MDPELKNKLFPFHQEKGLEGPSNAGRLIVIGDVHGCISELEKLIKKVRLQKSDQVLFLGDLINRGPDSKAVIRLAKALNANSLVGNHEYRLLQFYHNLDTLGLKPYELSTMKTLTAEDWNYLASMVLWLEHPMSNTVFVHGGFLPGIPWRRQSASVVTQVQLVDKTGNPRRRGEYSRGKFWADLWKQEPFVVYGHTPRPKVYRTTQSIGIDTGCVWGGRLTALILPDKKILQVSARKNYIK